MTRLPAFLHEPFAAAMSQSLLLPAFFALFGVVAALFLLGFGDPTGSSRTTTSTTRTATPATRSSTAATRRSSTTTSTSSTRCRGTTPEPVTQAEPVVQADPVDAGRRQRHRADAVARRPPAARARGQPGMPTPSSPGTLCSTDEPRRRRPSRRARAAARTWHSILDELLSDVPPARPKVEPIGFAHNGFHVDEEQRFQPLPPPAPEATQAVTPRAAGAPPPARRTTARSGRSGSSPTAGIPATTPTTRRATAGTRCRGATTSRTAPRG